MVISNQNIIAFLMAMALCSFAVSAQEAVFETDSVRYAIGTNGVSETLRQKTPAHSWLAETPLAFSAVKTGTKLYPVTSLKREGELWHAVYGDSGVQADFRITTRPHYMVFKLAHLTGNGVREVRLLQLPAACHENVGVCLGVAWNQEFTVNLLGLSDRVHVQATDNGVISASVYPEFGMEGQQVALLAVPTGQFLNVVQEVERDFALPSPKIGGQWAKTSPDVRTSYLFTDLTEANGGETIRYANLGGFKYVMTYSGTWSSSLGSYPINKNNFPQGEASLKATVDRCHAAGLKVGLHMLTSFVSKNDPLVRPKPDPRLLKDAQAILAESLDDKGQELTATAPLINFPSEPAFYGNAKAGCDIQIDDEIIQYQSIGGPGTNRFLRCVRGFAGTKAAPHQAGAAVAHLAERYGSYLADLRTTLKDQIADRVAGIINRCGFDMIFFDGGECNDANGPYWFWVSQQQDAICRGVKRDLLVQGSAMTHWTWHWFARGCCGDFAAVAPKQYLDYHIIADAWAVYHCNCLPAELGWWGLLDCTPDHPATTPDEVEFYATRMLALNTPVSLETHLAALRNNGRTEELLKLLGHYEQLRLSNAVPPEVCEQLRTGEWHLMQQSNKWSFVPIRYDTHFVTLPAELLVTNVFEAQPLKFRLQGLPTLAPPLDTKNIVLFQPDKPVVLELPPPAAAMPGALAKRVALANMSGGQPSVFMVGPQAQPVAAVNDKPLDLLHHRALAVTLRVDGAAHSPTEPCAVLNIQLESIGKTYRDYYIDLDFTGEKTVVIPAPTTERMLSEFRPPYANYNFMAAMYYFNYQKIVALNLRWMRRPRNNTVLCDIKRIEALAEVETPLSNPVLAMDGHKISLPTSLQPGDYLDYSASQSVTVFSPDSISGSTMHTTGTGPVLEKGTNRLRLSSDGVARAKLVLMCTGSDLGGETAFRNSSRPH